MCPDGPSAFAQDMRRPLSRHYSVAEGLEATEDCGLGATESHSRTAVLSFASGMCGISVSVFRILVFGRF